MTNKLQDEGLPRDSFADPELIQFMDGIGFELSHNEGIADWFVKDEGTSELTVFGARDMMQLILAGREAAVTEGKVEAAQYIQGHLMADEPEIIASNRTEDQDNTWFKAQLVFSNYISDDVIDPYITALQYPPKEEQLSKEERV